MEIFNIIFWLIALIAIIITPLSIRANRKSLRELNSLQSSLKADINDLTDKIDYKITNKANSNLAFPVRQIEPTRILSEIHSYLEKLQPVEHKFYNSQAYNFQQDIYTDAFIHFTANSCVFYWKSSKIQEKSEDTDYLFAKTINSKVLSYT